MRIDRERMLARAGANWSTANDLADRIVRAGGLDFRTAHHVAAALVRRSLEEGKAPAEVRSKDVDAAAEEILGRPLELGDDLVRDALDPVRFVATRVSEGSVSPAEVARMQERAAESSRAAQARIARERAALDEARRQLDAAIQRIMAA
jgi:argininosuccinate lyase